MVTFGPEFLILDPVLGRKSHKGAWVVATPMAFGTGILIIFFIHRGGTQVDDFTRDFVDYF